MSGHPRRPGARRRGLTPLHEDYVEAVFRREVDRGGVRVSDLAETLGCTRPTVTRMLAVLVKKGLIRHETRGLVYLTPEGRNLAAAVAHRHDDVFAFLTDVLGLPPEIAAIDTCSVEHGISPLAAKRLHGFMEYFQSLPESERRRIRRSSNPVRNEPVLAGLLEIRAGGWRA